MKKRISSFQYSMLKNEFQYLEEAGKLYPKQADELLECYEVETSYLPKKKGESRKTGISYDFIQIISIIGAVLIGLSVLSFVASNWKEISDLQKFLLLLSGFIVSYMIAWFLENRKPILSKSLYYIGIFMYGAEIFYIGQLFHLGGEIGNAFFVWGAIGFIALAFYKKDTIMYFMSFGLLYLSIELKFLLIDNGEPSYWMFVVLPVLFIVTHYLKTMNVYLKIANFVLLNQFVQMKFLFNDDLSFLWTLPIIIGLFILSECLFKRDIYLRIINIVILYQFIEMKIAFEAVVHKGYFFMLVLIISILFVTAHKWLNKSPILFGVNVLMAIQALLFGLHHLGVEQASWYFVSIFFIGLLFTHLQLTNYQTVMKWGGIVLQFCGGLILTMEFVYDVNTTFPIALVFGFVYLLYGFYLAYKNELFGVVLVSILIFRFYVDLSLVFMNKSIAFLIGGVLLLGLGYWFERTRRGEKKHEK